MKKTIIFSFIMVLLLTACGGYETTTLPSTEYDFELVFPSDQYPETALHIHGAIAQGYASICTINRDGAEANRKQSLAGIDTRNGYDRDEWPMAMCEEGGNGASVAYIDSSDNRGAGSWVGHQLSSYPNGAKVLFIVDKPKVLFPNHPVTAKPSDAPKATPVTGATEEQATEKDAVVYANCAAVRAAGKAPLHEGEPGYSRKLDRDGDGVACE